MRVGGDSQPGSSAGTVAPTYAQRLFDAHAQGAGDRQLRGIVAEGLKDIYFQDGENRATGLSDVEINDIDHLDLDY